MQQEILDKTTSRLRSEVALFSNFPPLLGDEDGGSAIFWMTDEFDVKPFWFDTIFLDVLFESLIDDGCLLTNKRCLEFRFLESMTESNFGSFLVISR